jgi:electron transfer flavoprotein alpha subunit
MKKPIMMIYLEQREGILQDVSLELLCEARRLALRLATPIEVVGVLPGYEIQHLAQRAIATGADRVILLDHPQLTHYSTLPYAEAVTMVLRHERPDSVLIGATVNGRDLAPRLAARLDTGLTADATKIDTNPNDPASTELWITRPAFGGNLYGTIVCPNHRPQMATIRPGVMLNDQCDPDRTGIIERFPLTLTAHDPVRRLRVVKKESTGTDITKARILISGGRGVLDHFDLLRSLAKTVGGEVSASRGVIDRHAAPKNLQVGQTGKTVKPSLYLACGISGAVQHTAGMDKSETIIAINTDPQAPIFGLAKLGIVGDATKILPLVIEKLKARHA